MADTKLTDLPALTAAQSSDLLYIVSLQQALSGESQKISLDDFFGNINTNVNVSDTLSATLVNTPQVNADNVLINNSLQADSIFTNTIRSNAIVQTLTANYTFTSATESSKIYNVDTTAGPITLSFDSSLPQGFNVGITNIGTDTITLSSTQTPAVYAIGTQIITQYAGCYVYKDVTGLYAVGKFD